MIRLPRSTVLRHALFFLPLAVVLLAVTYAVDAFTDYNIAGIAGSGHSRGQNVSPRGRDRSSRWPPRG